jgi:hypothetical protein
MDVALALAGGGDGMKARIGEETLRELEQFGVGAKALARMRDEPREHVVEIEPENADAARLFVAVQTQWRCTPRTNGKLELLERTGLDYSALPVVAHSLRLDLGEELLAQLRFLEAETLAIQSAKNAKLFAAR